MPKLMLVTGRAGPAADYTLPKVTAVADVVLVPFRQRDCLRINIPWGQSRCQQVPCGSCDPLRVGACSAMMPPVSDNSGSAGMLGDRPVPGRANTPR
jgi:hypothetical protein